MVWLGIALALAAVMVFVVACCKTASDEDDYLESVSPEPTAAPLGSWVRYDVPLEDGVQRYVYDLCTGKGIAPSLVYAIMSVESDYDATKIGDGGNSFGLMQIYETAHHDRCLAMGMDNLLNGYQNVTVGVSILDELMSKGYDLDRVLMAYNGGEGYAEMMIASGRTTTEYTEAVKAQMEIIAASATAVLVE